MKQISFCQQAKYCRSISLKSAAEITHPCHLQYLPEGNYVCFNQLFITLKATEINISLLVIFSSMSNVNLTNKQFIIDYIVYIIVYYYSLYRTEHFFKIGEISDNGGLNMTMITCDMIISRETG